MQDNTPPQSNSLKGLPNKLKLHSRLQEEFEKSFQSKIPMTCLKIKFDNLKVMIDQLEKSNSEQLLERVIKFMTSLLDTQDFLAQHDGDFFVILTPASHSKALRLGEYIQQSLQNDEFVTREKKVRLHPRVGLWEFPSDRVTNAEDLMKALTDDLSPTLGNETLPDISIEEST